MLPGQSSLGRRNEGWAGVGLALSVERENDPPPDHRDLGRSWSFVSAHVSGRSRRDLPAAARATARASAEGIRGGHRRSLIEHPGKERYAWVIPNHVVPALMTARRRTLLAEVPASRPAGDDPPL